MDYNVIKTGFPITSAAKKAFAENKRQYAKITFNGLEETLTIDSSDLVEGGLTIDRYSASGDTIEIGSVIAAEANVVLDNYKGKWNNVRFEGAELYIQIGVELDDGTVYYVPFGYFTVDEVPRKLSTISLTALDRMAVFDKPADFTQIPFPCSVSYLFGRICTLCGLLTGISSNSLVNATYIINDIPEGDDITYRQLLSWIAEITGTCAFIDNYGEVVLKWYTDTGYDISPADRYDSDLFESAITITGIQIAQNEETYLAGTDEYAISIESNPLIQHDINLVAENLFTAIGGFSYTPFSASINPSPDIYPLDVLSFTDADNTAHVCAVTSVGFNISANTEIEGKGLTLTRKGYATQNPYTKREQTIINKIKEDILNTPTQTETAALLLNETIANAMGLYRTEVEENGSTTYYFHNAETLEESSIIYTFNAGGFAWTDDWNDGSPVWQYGITRDGNALLKTLSVYKLTADYIDVDTLTVSKLLSKYGNTTIRIDPTVGMTITNGSNTLFNVNTNDCDIKLSANSISLSAQNYDGETTETQIEVGTLDNEIYSRDDYDSTANVFTRTSDGYYTSTNAGTNDSVSYGKMTFDFSAKTTVYFECISYGENNWDYGIVSNVDQYLGVNSDADSTYAKSFKGLSSSSPQTFTLTVPSGSHFVTFKYIKDSSTSSDGDYFKIKCYVLESTTGAGYSILTLNSGGVQLNSAKIEFKGLVSFEDLSAEGKTVINGANILTDNLHVKNVYSNIDSSSDYVILTSDLSSGGTASSVTLGRANISDGTVFTNLNLFGDYIYILSSSVEDKASNELGIDMISSPSVISPMSENHRWDIGSSSYPFRRLYVDRIYFSDGTHMSTAP